MADQLAQEIARAQLYHAATQYVRAGERIACGDTTQEQLRARQRALEAAALEYAATVAEEGGTGTPADNSFTLQE